MIILWVIARLRTTYCTYNKQLIKAQIATKPEKKEECRFFRILKREFSC